MTRPTSVRVLGRQYRVIWAHNALDQQAVGQAEHYKQHIYVRDDLPPEMERDTFLHEVLHCIWFLMDLDEPATEEKAVNAFSLGLTAFFSDNRKASEWLLMKTPTSARQ